MSTEPNLNVVITTNECGFTRSSGVAVVPLPDLRGILVANHIHYSHCGIDISLSMAMTVNEGGFPLSGGVVTYKLMRYLLLAPHLLISHRDIDTDDTKLERGNKDEWMLIYSVEWSGTVTSYNSRAVLLTSQPLTYFTLRYRR